MGLLTRSDYLYQARIYDNSNNLTGVFDDLVSITYRKIVNQVGLAVLTVPDDHPIVAQLVDDLLLEVFFVYKPLTVGGGEVTDQSDFLGLYRDKQQATDEDGNIHYLLYFVGILDILQRNIIAYPAGTNGKSQWTTTSPRNIANNIVQYNCTSLATTANGRLRNANVVRSLTSNGSGAGTGINFAVAYQNVLEVLQSLAAVGDFDFDIVRDLVSYLISFKTFAGQLGADRSTTILFDMALNNVVAASLDGGRLREKTVAIVGGAGEGSGRVTSIRTGANQSASNDYEIFVDARSNASTELDSIGDARLTELQARASIDIDIISSEGCVYRRDYKLGDLVTVSFGDTQQVKKINMVEVTFDQDQQTKIRVEFVDP